MEGSKLLRGVFFTLMCAIIMTTLYTIFFKVPIKIGDIKVNGALQYACYYMEYPISKYYYTYCFLPNVHMEDSIDDSLGADIDCDSSDSSFRKTEADLSSDDSDNSVFGERSSSYHHYSTGWH